MAKIDWLYPLDHEKHPDSLRLELYFKIQLFTYRAPSTCVSSIKEKHWGKKLVKHNVPFLTLDGKGFDPQMNETVFTVQTKEGFHCKIENTLLNVLI